MIKNLRRRIALWIHPAFETEILPVEEFRAMKAGFRGQSITTTDKPQTNTFDVLRAANIARNPEWFPDGAVPTLPASFRGLELSGEAGEMVEAALTHLAALSASVGRVNNVLKKLERERLGLNGSKSTIQALGEELGDLIICADLVGMDFDIDLWIWTVTKFNGTSSKLGMKTMLPTAERFVGKNPLLAAPYGDATLTRSAAVLEADTLKSCVLLLDDWLLDGIHKVAGNSHQISRRGAFVDARTKLHNLFPDYNEWAIERDGVTYKPVKAKALAPSVIPDIRDVVTHQDAWHNAIQMAWESATTPDDETYWSHEMNVFTRTFDYLIKLHGLDTSRGTPKYTYDQLSDMLKPFAQSGESLATHTPAGLVGGNLYVAVKNPGAGWRYQALHATVDDLEKACGLKISTMPENKPQPKKVDYESFMPAFTKVMAELADSGASADKVSELFWNLYPKG